MRLRRLLDKNKSREPLIPKRTEGGRCFQDPNLPPSEKKIESPPRLTPYVGIWGSEPSRWASGEKCASLYKYAPS